MRYMSISQKEILYNDFMNRLKELRLQHEYKQQYIADVLSVKQNTYSQYETGVREIPISALIVLAKLYNTSIDYILALTDVEEPYPSNSRAK